MNNINLRVYERICGETLACGTGAASSVISGILNDLNEYNVNVHLKGGMINIEVDNMFSVK